MAIEDIVKKIISDAETEAAAVLDGYKKEADSFLADKKALLASLEKESRVKAGREAEDYFRRLVQRAELEMRKDALQLKQQLVGDVFRMVEERVLSLPRKEYQDFIAGKIMQYIETGREEVLVSEKDRERLTEDFISRLNSDLKEKLKEEGKLRLSAEAAPIKGGFILRSEKKQFNGSLESLLKEVRERIEADIVKKLF